MYFLGTTEGVWNWSAICVCSALQLCPPPMNWMRAIFLIKNNAFFLEQSTSEIYPFVGSLYPLWEMLASSNTLSHTLLNKLSYWVKFIENYKILWVPRLIKWPSHGFVVFDEFQPIIKCVMRSVVEGVLLALPLPLIFCFGFKYSLRSS